MLKKIGRALGALVLTLTAGATQANDFLSASARFKPDSAGGALVDGIEKGELRGIAFAIFRDGSGMTSGWSRSCKQDRMTDERHCFVSKGDLSVMVERAGVVYVSIGHEHFPRTRVTLRVDSKKPRSTDDRSTGWHGAEAKAIATHILSGKSVRTRYTNWPHELHVEESLDVAGLAEGIEIAQWAVKQK